VKDMRKEKLYGRVEKTNSSNVENSRKQMLIMIFVSCALSRRVASKIYLNEWSVF